MVGTGQDEHIRKLEHKAEEGEKGPFDGHRHGQTRQHLPQSWEGLDDLIIEHVQVTPLLPFSVSLLASTSSSIPINKYHYIKLVGL
jgi:hypothetical protein